MCQVSLVVKYIFTFLLKVLELFHLRCPSYLYEQIDFSHIHICAIWEHQCQRYLTMLFVY